MSLSCLPALLCRVAVPSLPLSALRGVKNFRKRFGVTVGKAFGFERDLRGLLLVLGGGEDGRVCEEDGGRFS